MSRRPIALAGNFVPSVRCSIEMLEIGFRPATRAAMAAVVLQLGACAPDGSVANAAEDFENASEVYANRTDERFEKIGNDLTPRLANTIDQLDGDAPLAGSAAKADTNTTSQRR